MHSCIVYVIFHSFFCKIIFFCKNSLNKRRSMFYSSFGRIDVVIPDAIAIFIKSPTMNGITPMINS